MTPRYEGKNGCRLCDAPLWVVLPSAAAWLTNRFAAAFQDLTSPISEWQRDLIMA